jgi:hypothetical protein
MSVDRDSTSEIANATYTTAPPIIIVPSLCITPYFQQLIREPRKARAASRPIRGLKKALLEQFVFLLI